MFSDGILLSTINAADNKQTENSSLRLFRSSLFGPLVLRQNKDWVHQTNKVRSIESGAGGRRLVQGVSADSNQPANCLKVCPDLSIYSISHSLSAALQILKYRSLLQHEYIYSTEYLEQ